MRIVARPPPAIRRVSAHAANAAYLDFTSEEDRGADMKSDIRDDLAVDANHLAGLGILVAKD